MLNLVAKSALLFWYNKLSVSDISPARRCFLHFGAPIITVALAAADQWSSPPDSNNALVTLLDPYLAVGMCMSLCFTVLPIFMQNLSFLLLCDVPKCDREGALKSEIEQTFPSLKCQHIHCYKKWPGHKFDTFMHVTVAEQQKQQHSPKLCAASEHGTNKSHRFCPPWTDLDSLHKMLRVKGARRVTVQPWLAVNGEQQQQQSIRNNCSCCVCETCREKQCCEAVEDEEKEKKYEI
ncbi:hypothetical protein niasHS_005409 [Heterodera schachtii]|uniref:CSC1/OSCA1-like cytosolic domain-containing protein n=1 Tax=Heterodera schachtii TaxID=97005 RepID=A0ABD2J9C6_HETSC